MRTLSIEREQFLLFVRIESFMNCLDRACGYASAAIDADIRINVTAFVVRMKALDRAVLDTIGEEAKAAVIGDDMGHACLQSEEPSGYFLSAGRP